MIKSPQKIDQMLLQLRQLLHDSSNNKQPTPTKYISNRNIQSLIQQSTKLIQNSKYHNSSKPVIKGKILAASQLLKGEKGLIRNYVKQKIESQLFHSHSHQKQQKPIEIQKIHQEKQHIIDLKQRQIQREAERRKRIIENVKQFQTDSRVRISIHEIDSMIFKEEPESSYLMSLTPSNSKKITSKSNQVKNSNLYLSDIYSIQEYEREQNPDELTNKTLRRNLKNSPSGIKQNQNVEQYQEVLDEPENGQNFSDIQIGNQNTFRLNQALKKHPHLVKIFYKFLENQIKINSLGNAFGTISNMISDQTAKMQKQKQQSQNYVWKNTRRKAPSKLQFQNSKKQSQKTHLNESQQNINKISQQFRFKGFSINEDNKVEFQRQKISQRRINKMIGQSKDFHPKKCILTKKQLIYFEQKQKQSQSQYFQLVLPQDSKNIEIDIQSIAHLDFIKQEGSFFSKKQLPIQLINLKGKNRFLKFEKNFLDGNQLVNDLQKLMANRVYTHCCRISGENNLRLFSFVNNQNVVKFDVSDGFIIPAENFVDKQSRQLFMQILGDLNQNRKKVYYVYMIQSRLLPSQLSYNLQYLKKFQSLKAINLSQTRITKQNFVQLCQLVNENHAQSQFQVTLRQTKLDDELFTSNVGVFTSFCSKVKFLDISDNNITSKTLQIIKNCFQSVTCQIRHLLINNCPIRDMSRIPMLLKESRKLQILQAQNCLLNIQDKSENEFQKLFDFLKKCSPQVKYVNLSGNGGLNESRYNIVERLWNVETLEKLQIDIAKELMSQKGQKSLLRTENGSLIKNHLNLQLCLKQSYKLK